MNFELFIAKKYLLTRQKQSFISIITIISILGVALGVAALIIVLGVMNGFSQNLENKILGVNAHIIIGSYTGPIQNYSRIIQLTKKIQGIKSVAPFLYSEVMASGPGGVKGLILRGIRPQDAKVFELSKTLVAGNIARLDQSSPFPGIILGKELVSQLGLTLGSKVNILAPSSKKTSIGFTPKIVTFELIGIFNTGMYEYDSSLGYISLRQAQKMLGLKKNSITALEVRVFDIYKAPLLAKKILEQLGYPYYTRNWIEMNKNLFSALKLEKTAMGIILSMIILVGTFSIVTALIMLVTEKTKDIAVMISMGATPKRIKKIFMFQGIVIGIIGTFLGYIVGLSICFLLKKYQFIKLPKGVYYIDHLPILLKYSDLIIIGCTAIFLCFLATLYPAKQAAKLEPAIALRYE
ncbi:MAG: lipoprotein-releasing ABC transporter permease subunit [Desulfonauticus sp.]|nr:lipoprotein-releasing ABC transporter permease subunit [Desulfonauticus sp.]